MKNILLVPVHLDALTLGRDELVLEATADFSRLPYTDGKRDVNADTPHLSEAIVTQEFQDKNLNLKAGIHLHWALPDGLTRGAQAGGVTEFPRVPNRWLLRRSRKKGFGQLFEKSWVVESDYLYPEGAGARSGSVSYPHRPDPKKGEHQPFRYAGRKMPLEAWGEGTDKAAEYMERLTAVGYGEPSFAALYPNCHSVFGFYDEDYRADGDLAGLRYDLYGWYSDPSKDHLGTFVAAFRKRFEEERAVRERRSGAAHGSSPGITNDDIREAVEASLGWTFTLNSEDSFPENLVCHGSLTFGSGTGAGVEKGVEGIAVANTSTEALSAYLAERVDPAHKSKIEDQLEAILLSSRLADRRLDVGPKFEEARHEKGFNAVAGGTLWTVTLENKGAGPADAGRAGAQSQITLPEELAHKLNSVNIRQQALDQALQVLESRRRQLFSDWYKYMLAAYPPEGSRDDYPDPVEVRNFIERKVLARLKAWEAAAGTLRLSADGAGNVTGADASGSRPDSLAALLASELDALAKAVAGHNETARLSDSKAAFRLRQTPGPRYYRPNDPVVLVVGAAAKPSERHGRDGRLSGDGLLGCRLLLTPQEEIDVPKLFDELYRRVEQMRPADYAGSIAFRLWNEQPWNPFLLEWEAEMFPVESGGNLDPDSGDYSDSYITKNYTLAENGVDLSALPGRGFVAKAAAVYSGRSILTPHALDRLRPQLEAYLREQILPDYLKVHDKIPAPDNPSAYFDENRAAILGWYKQNRCGDPTAATCRIVSAYELLDAEGFHALSQSLGGFNEALLMRRQTMQLDIADPLGFDDERSFTDEAVRGAVGVGGTSAPRPLNDFLPIRAGALKLLRLRLVDTFGRAREIDCTHVVTTEKLKDEKGPYPLMLPPRLAQPARLNFRWLSAEGDDAEMNEHPATTPVCGWLLPNNLDGSLLVYDGKGAALGSIDQKAAWLPAPGSIAAVEAAQIKNDHLRKLVAHVIECGRGFVEDFLSALDNALENIEPESFAQHQGLALLFGRPVALVRASLNLELQGEPAVHQGWNHFRQDMLRHCREDTGFTHVLFPVRLGEYRQLNDGLVGYWVEEGAGYKEKTFYAPQTEGIADPLIKTHADDPMTVYQSVAAPPHVLSMLIDPRGTVHACSGIAPVKSIQIPPDQYAEALRNIEVTFLTSPVLTELGVVRLPLAPEPDFKWTWLSRVAGAWSEVSTAGTLHRRAVRDAFGDRAEALWAVLKDKGWIKETELGSETAGVTAKDLRGQSTLGDEWAAREAEVERMLAATYIGPVVREATFSGRQSIVEGWLKLSGRASGTKQ
jgi:hypothetical protein